MNQSDTIDPRLLDRGFTEEQLALLMKNAKNAVMGNTIRSLNVRISGDLKRFNLGFFDYILSLYHIYSKTGSLPYKGSISEQPAKVMEIMNIIERLSIERQENEIKRREREVKKNG